MPEHGLVWEDGVSWDQLKDAYETACQEREAARDEAKRYRLVSLGMVDPVRVGQIMTSLQRERDEARKIATHLMRHSVDCGSYQAELIESYPWMKALEAP